MPEKDESDDVITKYEVADYLKARGRTVYPFVGNDGRPNLRAGILSRHRMLQFDKMKDVNAGESLAVSKREKRDR